MKYPILIGSQALKFYKNLVTKPSDWDFLMPKKDFKRKILKVDITDADKETEPTNKIIFELSQKSNLIVDTPIGKAKVMPIELLKVLKISSLPQNKLKHKKHLELLKTVRLSSELKDLAKKRTQETINRNKNKFFNKYKVERYFDHDELHLFIKQKPTYLKALKKDGVTICKNKFNKLSFKDKKSLFYEEAFVLGLERFLIPNIKKNSFLVDYYCDQFFKVETNSNPSVYWLNKLCFKNKLKDHPVWLQKWGYSNYELLIKDFNLWWNKSFNQIPEVFWERLLG